MTLYSVIEFIFSTITSWLNIALSINVGGVYIWIVALTFFVLNLFVKATKLLSLQSIKSRKGD